MCVCCSGGMNLICHRDVDSTEVYEGVIVETCCLNISSYHSVDVRCICKVIFSVAMIEFVSWEGGQEKNINSFRG